MRISNLVFRRAAAVLLLASMTAGAGEVRRPSGLSISDITSDKARYAPGEAVKLEIQLENRTGRGLEHGRVVVLLEDCGRTAAREEASVDFGEGSRQSVAVTVRPPKIDFRGYRVEVRIFDAKSRELARRSSAVDVSSAWTRFPRYGYIAHFGSAVPAEQWIAELNRFHIDGLQFYDVQYKHHLPLVPGQNMPGEWADIAGRRTSRNTVLALLSAAKSRNMTSMAYNASYAAYADAFHDGSGVKLEWAAWPDRGGRRTEESVKSFALPGGWATPRLLYMNQQSSAWQQYIFGRMGDLFQALPFDGWHIDTYGDGGAWTWDRSPLNFVAGLPKFADRAQAALGKRVVLNTVGGHGEAAMARSAADFVYSELWPEDHSTYASILRAADETHAANPERAIVFAAYLHNGLAQRLKKGETAQFNAPGVLLADAAMFAAGASHMELGDGDRMLSGPYFPADTAITQPPALRRQLGRYYDFLVAYENYLRDGAVAAAFPVTLSGAAQTQTGAAGAVWTIVRQKGAYVMVHLINLTGMKRNEWRDDAANYPKPTVVKNLRVQVRLPADIRSAGWASPDLDGGGWHALQPTRTAGVWELSIPELRYWNMMILHCGESLTVQR